MNSWRGPNSWLAFVLPLGVFLVVGAAEPAPSTSEAAAGWVPYAWYPAIYGVKILLTVAALIWSWPAIAAFPRRCGWLAVVVGIVGAAIWLGLGEVHAEARLLRPLGFEKMLGAGARTAFDPFAQLGGRPALLYGFLAVRLFGLAVVIAIAEELFLRGFVVRWIVDPDHWPRVPFGQLNAMAAVFATVLPMTMHVGEFLAAAIWFSMVTWLMHRTRSFWDCVVAHAVTNLLLGVYVLVTGHWWFW